MRKPIIIGLTGSIGMGKTTVAAQFARLGAKVCNADAIVHRLLGSQGAAVEAVSRLFPGVVKDGVVDRKALGARVFHDTDERRKLERLLHPLVVAAEQRFVRRQASKGMTLIVLDIPLLFETGADKRCNVTVVASAPPVVQRQRVLKRAGMTEEKFHAILCLQMPDREKRTRADFVIPTGQGRAVSFRHVKQIIGQLYAT